MKIKEIEIKNYKGFEELCLKPAERNMVLFGVNGVGKSTVLSAINYIFYIFLRQLNPSQSTAFGSFEDDQITVGKESLEIRAQISMDGVVYLLSRYYKRSQKNNRTVSWTFPKTNYSYYKEIFRNKYLESDEVGMPIFIHYGTNRTVMNVSLSRSKDTQYDKLSAIERAVETDSDFKSFFEWYLRLETSHLLDSINKSDDKQNSALGHVNKVIEYMLGDVKKLEVRNNPLRIVAQKGENEIRVDQLSDGEKCTLALLGDLTRRLCLANPMAKNPLEGSGIVLIDEIELHMHPSWQRKILPALRHLFPNIQFIVTTHSPQVLGEATDEYELVSLYKDEQGKNVARINGRMDGYDSNLILEEYMNTPSESDLKRSLVKKANESIRLGEYGNAEMALEELKNVSGDDDAEYILAKGYLQRMRVK